MDAPVKSPLLIQQGADVEIILPPVIFATGQSVDWTGFIGRMQIREDANSPLLLELTTAAGGIVINGSQVKLVFTNAQTSAFNFGLDFEAQYDMELVQPGTGLVFKPYYGPVKMIPEVTR